MAKKEENLLEKILEYLKDILKINKEHKEITKDLNENSMKKKEQRVWNSITISLMILAIILGGGLLYLLAFDNNVDSTLEISVSPEEIMLNEKGDIDFEIKFTNTGDKNLKNFDVLKMDLYRLEAENLTYKRQIIYSNNDYSISCTNGGYEIHKYNLDTGESCIVKADMYSCPECFDDKDKKVYLLIYFDSVPPIQNRMVKIPIY